MSSVIEIVITFKHGIHEQDVSLEDCNSWKECYQFGHEYLELYPYEVASIECVRLFCDNQNAQTLANKILWDMHFENDFDGLKGLLHECSSIDRTIKILFGMTDLYKGGTIADGVGCVEQLEIWSDENEIFEAWADMYSINERARGYINKEHVLNQWMPYRVFLNDGSIIADRSVMR